MDFSNYETVQDFGMLPQWEKDRELCFFAAKNDLNSVKKVALLIAAGANINYQSTSSNLTPLLLATTTGHISTMELLIQAGAKLSASTINHETALSRAIFYQYDNKASLLFNNMSEADLDAEIECNRLRQQTFDPACRYIFGDNSCFIDMHKEALFKKLKALAFPPAKPLIFTSAEPKSTNQEEVPALSSEPSCDVYKKKQNVF